MEHRAERRAARPAPTANASPNTPIGASHSTQPTTTSIASWMPEEAADLPPPGIDPRQGEGEDGGEHDQRQHLVFAAAAIGLVGIRLLAKSWTVGTEAPLPRCRPGKARRAALRPPRGQRKGLQQQRHGDRAESAELVSTITNHSNERPAIRPPAPGRRPTRRRSPAAR